MQQCRDHLEREERRLGYVAFTLAMTLGRTFGDRWRSRYGAAPLVLAGALLSWFIPRLRSEGKVPELPRALVVLGLFAALLVALGVSVAHSLKRASSGDQHLALSRSALRDVGDCVFTFEPGWSLAAGRLPPRLPGTPLVIDNYGQQLLAAVSGGHRFPDAATAFASATVLPRPMM